MFNVLIKTFIAILVVLTLIIGVKQPAMHNKIQIYDNSYVTVENNNQKEQEKTVIKEVKVIPSKEISKNENKVVKKEVKNQSKQETKTEISKKTDNAVSKQTKNSMSKSADNKTKTNLSSKTQTTTTVKAPEPVVSTQTTQKTQKTQEQIEQEELIAWNIWHSKIQNSLMKDVKMPYIPEGIIFKFSFTVDKYGRITNINTYSTTPKYTPYAIEYIAPVIRSYQGKSILDFPKGSERVSNFFSGSWKMSKGTTKYSTPSDYNDIEKVTR